MSGRPAWHNALAMKSSPASGLDAWIPRLLSVWRAARRTPARKGARPPEDALLPEELREVASAVTRLSTGLTRERELVGARYMDDERLLAASTDSVGTKLILARQRGALRLCGADLAALLSDLAANPIDLRFCSDVLGLELLLVGYGFNYPNLRWICAKLRALEVPASGGNCPTSVRSSVDLPQPFGPTMARRWPRRSIRSGSCPSGRSAV